MRRFDRASALLIVAICIVLGCTAVLLIDSGWRRDLSGFAATDEPAHISYRMIVVFRPEDCDGRLDFIHLAAQPHFHDVLSVTGVLVGSAAEGRFATQRLRARGLDLPLLVRRKSLSSTARLGYSSTPYLMIVDSNGRLRFAMTAPRTTRDMKELEQVIRILVLAGNADAAA